MARNALARLQNSAGHHYEFYSAGNCHVCTDCGTAEHRNGRFYYVGRWSKDEPPCEGNHIGRQLWLEASNPDEAWEKNFKEPANEK
ncbi:hypothetical protein CBW22_07615 [Pantoea sp. VS1]|uniref:hypothetical protein n=1 Tax=Pantoea sp. VS1 TaxID=2003658 RepID=UPI000B50E012|nr:hypothetical protein [Pantoea sp. VS1]OWS76320.1 hypothetical protein CBW22_07615 [Pantoea sp. VS1]